MAKYIPSALFEEFKGHIGNNVFAKNKAGKYLRSYVIPSNPQTTSQVIARQIFANVAPGWGALTVQQRSDFDVFANSSYLPLNRPDPTTTYTGRQSYSALKIAADWSSNFITNTSGYASVFSVGATAATTIVDASFSGVSTPPSAYLTNNVLSFNNLNYNFVDFSLSSYSNQDIRVLLTLSAQIPTGAISAKPMTIGGSQFALSVYLSNPLSFDGQKTESDFVRKLFTTKVYGNITITPGAASNELKLGCTRSSGNFNRPLGWHKVSIIATTVFGGQRVLLQKFLNLA